MDELTAAEAVYGFAAWLTTRDEPTVMSAKNDSAPIATLVGEFCKENKLEKCRDGWEKNLIHPSGECSGPAETAKDVVDKKIKRPAPIVGCGLCGGQEVEIRGRHPGDEKRKVCPTCMRERLDTIEEMSSEGYGKAYMAE
jgi:hypothetical protein